MHYMNEGNDINRSDYANGYCLFAFDLTPDLSAHFANHWNLIKHGTIRIEVGFEIDAEFDNVIEIDSSRQVIADYKSQSPFILKKHLESCSNSHSKLPVAPCFYIPVCSKNPRSSHPTHMSSHTCTNMEKIDFIIDIQGFHDKNGDFLLKEVAVLGVDCNYFAHWIIKPACDSNTLPRGILATNSYLTVYHHGIE